MSGPGNAAAAAAGAPPPAMGGAVAPQFPYDPDPGSITGWILADLADVDDAEMVRSYQANIQRYADLSAVGAADYVSQVDNLISDCIFTTSTRSNPVAMWRGCKNTACAPTISRHVRQPIRGWDGGPLAQGAWPLGHWSHPHPCKY